MKTTLQVVESWLDSLYLKHLAVCDIIISQQRPSTANEVFSTLTKVLSSFGCCSCEAAATTVPPTSTAVPLATEDGNASAIPLTAAHP